MAFDIKQQAAERILRAKQILITTNEHASVDALASALGLGLVLRRLQKPFEIYAKGYNAANLPNIFPRDIQIRSELGATHTFHVRVSLEKTPLAELMYEVNNNILDISLVPKRGSWSIQDVGVEQGHDRYDLIIAIDCPDMPSLGLLAREQAEFVYRTDVLNIDCQPANEHWGQINLIDLNAVSTTEVIYHWIRDWQPSLLDEDLATTLLAGMMAKTKSFRTNKITSRTLTASSELVSLGAKRESIVHGLWRTRTVATLKLWGRVLARLQQDRDLGLVWSALSANDALEAGANPDTIEGVVDELIAYAPEAKVVALFCDHQDKRTLDIHAQTPFSAVELARPLGGHGTREQARITLTRDSALVDEVQTVVERLRQTMKTLQSKSNSH